MFGGSRHRPAAPPRRHDDHRGRAGHQRLRARGRADESISTSTRSSTPVLCAGHRAVHVDVIGTMRLAAAAAQPGSTVRTVAAASSVARLPGIERAPRRRREQRAARPRRRQRRRSAARGRALPAGAGRRQPAHLRRRPPAGRPRWLAASGTARQAVERPDRAGRSPGSIHPSSCSISTTPHTPWSTLPAMSLAGTYNVAGDGALHWSGGGRLALTSDSSPPSPHRRGSPH